MDNKIDKRHSIFNISLIVYFLSLVFIPHFIFVSLGQSSPSVGLFSLLIVFSLLFFVEPFRTLLQVNTNFLVILVVFVFLLLVHCSVTAFYYFDFSLKTILSLVFVFFVIAHSYFICNVFIRVDVNSIKRFLDFYINLFVGVGWLGLAFSKLLPVYSSLPKPVFPFSEPSHYSLAVSIFLASNYFFSSVKRRLFLLANFTLLSVLFPNLTLLVVMILTILTSIRRISLKVILSAISLLVCVAYILSTIDMTSVDYLVYIQSRLSELSSESTNSSTLVYIQGWDDLRRSMVNTYGFGYGFQRLGLQEPSDISLLIYDIAGGYLNREDGGFILAKFVSELGFLAILAVIFVLYQSISLIRRIRRKIVDAAIPYEYVNSGEYIKIRLAVIVSILFLVEFLFRGYGYFTPNVMFVLAMQMFIFRKRFLS